MSVPVMVCLVVKSPVRTSWDHTLAPAVRHLPHRKPMISSVLVSQPLWYNVLISKVFHHHHTGDTISCALSSVKDADECTTDAQQCTCNGLELCEASCQNTVGSYTCSCNEGFVLSETNDKECIGE